MHAPAAALRLDVAPGRLRAAWLALCGQVGLGEARRVRVRPVCLYALRYRVGVCPFFASRDARRAVCGFGHPPPSRLLPSVFGDVATREGWSALGIRRGLHASSLRHGQGWRGREALKAME